MAVSVNIETSSAHPPPSYQQQQQQQQQSPFTNPDSSFSSSPLSEPEPAPAIIKGGPIHAKDFLKTLPPSGQRRPRARVIDIIHVNNELDILEVRMEELDSVVDLFVMIESENTFRMKAKSLYFRKNKDRFKKFANKTLALFVPELSWESRSRIVQEQLYSISWGPEEVIVALNGVDSDNDENRSYRLGMEQTLKVLPQQNATVYNDFIALSNPSTPQQQEGQQIDPATTPAKTRPTAAGANISQILYKLRSSSHREYNHKEMANKAWILDRVRIGENYKYVLAVHGTPNAGYLDVDLNNLL
ncbi:MAG: glycosyltransferase family 17-domain-containing protein [Linnemannia gamsii]|nr:MAG: glycosyltransferase family 17-domain-containing protein [Linnemannia gamsii]